MILGRKNLRKCKTTSFPTIKHGEVAAVKIFESPEYLKQFNTC